MPGSQSPEPIHSTQRNTTAMYLVHPRVVSAIDAGRTGGVWLRVHQAEQPAPRRTTHTNASSFFSFIRRAGAKQPIRDAQACPRSSASGR